MRGSLWAVAAAGIFGALLLRGVGTATPSAPSSVTANVSGILQTGIGSMAGLILMLFAVGALVAFSFARGF